MAPASLIRSLTPTGRQTDRQTDRQKDRKTDSLTHSLTHSHRQTDRQTLAYSQTDIHIHTHAATMNSLLIFKNKSQLNWSKTRMHSSRMRTVLCSGCLGGGVSAREGVYPSMQWGRHPLPPRQNSWHTLVKTLPFRKRTVTKTGIKDLKVKLMVLLLPLLPGHFKSQKYYFFVSHRLLETVNHKHGVRSECK